MKKLLIHIVSLVLFCSFFPTTFAQEEIFPDIADHPYWESILYLYYFDVVEGYPDGEFKPNRSLNRAEMLKIVLEASPDHTVGSGTNCFPDVHDERFAPYVCYAKEHNIIKGYPDGTFKPGRTVIIPEALKMGIQSFGHDVSEPIHDTWYQGYVDFVHYNNIFSKYSYLVGADMTRGKMAYVTHQLMLENQGDIEFTGERYAGSLGCGIEPPQIPPTSSSIAGMQRSYITDVGREYDKNKPSPLIFVFHGRTNSNEEVRRYLDVNETVSDDAIVVYPSGLPEAGPQRNRSDPGDPAAARRDYALFDQLLTEFSEQYCIDRDRVFVMGHSLGAWFANSLSCARGNVIRGVGSVGGSTSITQCTGPVAGMIMHHPEDRLASFQGGITARDQMLRQNGCTDTTIPVGPEEGNCVQYVQCQEGAPVVWCPHSDDVSAYGTYYPHTRPDFATNEIREFFVAQP